MVPCGDGLDDVIDLLKGCMKSQAGLEWNDCGGKSTQRIKDYAGQIMCEGGGTLADKISDGDQNPVTDSDQKPVSDGEQKQEEGEQE